MNFEAPSLWTIVGFLIVAAGWLVGYGKLSNQVSTNSGRLNILENTAKRALEEGGHLITFETHERICGANFERFEKMLDLKLVAMKNELLLAIKSKDSG